MGLYIGNKKVTPIKVTGGGEISYIPREVSATGKLVTPQSPFVYTLPLEVTDIGDRALMLVLNENENLLGVDLRSLIRVTGADAFRDCFSSCANLQTIDFGNLETISGFGAFAGAFNNVPSLLSINLTKLHSITAPEVFSASFMQSGITNISFDNLSLINAEMIFSYAFAWSSHGIDIRFPALNENSFGDFNNQFDNMLYYASNCTVHFPSSIEHIISNWWSVMSGFGGNNTTILFDL